MRLPVIGNISTKDGATNKNARLTNMLAEQKKNGTTLATVRPGIDAKGTTAGVGNGLVCFNGTLVSVYESSVLIPVVSEEYVFNSFYPQVGPSNNKAYAVTPNGEIVVGVVYKSGIPTAFISEPYSEFNYDISAYATAYAVSGSGSTVVGAHSTLKAFRWTLSEGMVSLGTVNGTAYGISSDGNIIVGYSGSTAYRWTSAGGLEDLGTLSGAASSQAYGISGDGTTIVGYSFFTAGSIYKAFKWTEAGGMVDIGTLGGTSSIATAVSEDGSVIVGYSQITGNAAYHAFRWTDGGGMQDLGLLSGTTNTYATAVSPDGNSVVGRAYTGTNFKGFKWTAIEGMSNIGTLGGTYCSPLGISSYGEIVGGSYVSGDTTEDVFHAAYEEVVDFMAGGTVQSDQYDFALIP